MKEFFQDIIIPLGVICIALAIILSSNKAQKENNSKTYSSNDKQFAEWVSPDGVHYWIRESGHQGYMAPRYDSDGNLVIDKVVE